MTTGTELTTGAAVAGLAAVGLVAAAPPDTDDETVADDSATGVVDEGTAVLATGAAAEVACDDAATESAWTWGAGALSHAERDAPAVNVRRRVRRFEWLSMVFSAAGQTQQPAERYANTEL